MNYTLTGKIARTQPHALDKTLTVEDAAAEAKATGEAIETARAEASEHANSTENPHNVTKSQVGLDAVDNTSDMDKPVSALQAEAIGLAENAANNAYALAEEVRTLADTAQTTADEAKAAAETAQTTADEAKALAEEAKNITHTTLKTVTVQMFYVDWEGNEQTVNVEGVTADNTVIVSPAPDSFATYTENGVVCTAQGEGTLSFKCENVPDDMTVNVVILGVSE